MAKTKTSVKSTKAAIEAKTKKTARPAAPKTSAAKTRTGEGHKAGEGERRASEERRKTDRRTQNVPVAVERRKLERRVKVNRRRQIDPTTCERDYTAEELEFMNALDQYKRTSGRMFPTCSEMLEVFKNLGYEKRPAAEPTTEVPLIPTGGAPFSPAMEPILPENQMPQTFAAQTF